KRFAALRFVFIFGMLPLLATRRRLLLRRHDHDHHPAFHRRHTFHLTDVLQRFRHFLQHLATQFRMRDLPATEHHGDLHLVTLFQKAARMPDLELEVMRLDHGTHLDFLDLRLVLLLARCPSLPRLLVLELAVVHDADHRRPRRRRNFYEVETLLLCRRQGLLHRQNPELLAVRSDDTDGADADLPVDADSTLCRYGKPPRENKRTRCY